MSAPRLEALKDWAARACVLPILAAPVSNPDLFWHLNAARRILEEGRLPRYDSWSFTRLGAPWVDFEWAFQLSAYAVHESAGWGGLWALKALLWTLCAALVELLGRLSGGAARGRLLLVFWAAMSLGRAELKPELFSAVFFLAGLWRLEAGRRGLLETPRPARAALAAAATFALWANLHPGFAGGLGLLAVYAALSSGPQRRALAAAAAAGAAATLLNPYGWGVWAVLADHARHAGLLSRHILEWRALSAAHPMHWPALAVLGAAAAASAADRALSRGSAASGSVGAADRALSRGSAASGSVGAAVLAPRRARFSALEASAWVWGLAALRQARHMTYAGPLAGLALLESSTALADRMGLSPARRRVVAACAALAAAGFLAQKAAVLCLPLRAVELGLFPVRAAEFVAADGEFRRRRLFNEWGWGGYLAWRLGPDTRVFMDGRYLFHGLLGTVFDAARSPATWRDLLDGWGIEWAMVTDESRGGFEPFEWALVYRDPAARVYVRRGAFSNAWIREREVPVPRGKR
ncbi:MAG: hypothetical protein HYZ75_07980 [Elusimicrobia bacterium]|nr:hypothetical protein [Elusimicrobiota bacterium]